MPTRDSPRVPVLVVDDVAANLLAMQAVLGDEEYELVDAASGAEAVAAVERREFAVVLLDARMPGMDGFETAIRLRDAVAGRRPVPIILVTAADENDDQLRRAYEAGAADFVRKPLDRTVLKAKVRVFADLYRAHQHLADSELRFHHLVDAVVDYAIFMLDEEGRVATWNSGAQKAKGYLASEIQGRHFSIFYTEEDRRSGRPNALLDVVRREGRVEDRGWRVRKDGSRFWAGVVISALYGPNGEVRGFAKVTRDLTAEMASSENERVLQREQLARRELERLDQAKDQFVATLSHELRTPLNAISGWTAILKRSSTDPQLLARALDVIDRNTRAQTRLISDLLDVSRIASGKLLLDLAETQLLPTLAQAADVLRPVAEAKGVQLVTDLSPDLGVLYADADRLAQNHVELALERDPLHAAGRDGVALRSPLRARGRDGGARRRDGDRARGHAEALRALQPGGQLESRVPTGVSASVSPSSSTSSRRTAARRRGGATGSGAARRSSCVSPCRRNRRSRRKERPAPWPSAPDSSRSKGRASSSSTTIRTVWTTCGRSSSWRRRG